jgi:hypothetical protein
MAGKSDYLENAVLNHVLRNTALTSPTTVYLGLLTATPSDSAAGTEVSGNAYARQAVTFGAPSPAGQVANSGVVNFPAATPSGWGTIVATAIYDASSAGNMLYWAALSPNQVVGVNGVLSFPIGQIVVTED